MLEGVKFMAFDLANCHYKKVPRNLTNCGRLCIISCWGGLEVLPHKLPHTQTTTHTAPPMLLYITIETMEHLTKNTQKLQENLIEKIGRKTYKFDFYNLNGSNYLRISRVSGKKEYIVKVYTGDLNGKKEEFLKIATGA